MSITAFPVLARIIQERGLARTEIGLMAITCAASDDITAWCLLAVVIAIVKAGSFVSALYTIGLAIGFVIFMLLLVKPFLKRIGDVYSNKEAVSKPVMAIIFLTLLLSAYASEVIGIHALFGAFMAGVIMPPEHKFRNILINKIEDVALILLLPLFFVFTGLKTDLSFLAKGQGLWQICLMIIGVAVFGKIVGASLTTRLVGQSWKNSFMMGTLMNTRGLMELVVLNIGLELGVLGEEIFAMMVLMALTTTFMTGPILNFIEWVAPDKKDSVVENIINKYKVLISFGNPQSGKRLLQVADLLVSNKDQEVEITAMHLSPDSDTNPIQIAEYERTSFLPIKEEAELLKRNIQTEYKVALEINKEIISSSNEMEANLLLVGAGQSIYHGTMIGKIAELTNKILSPDKLLDTITGKEKIFNSDEVIDERILDFSKNVEASLGVFLDKGHEEVKHVFVPVFGRNDEFLMTFVDRMLSHNQVQVTVYDVMGLMDDQMVDQMHAKYANHLVISHQHNINKSLFVDKDFMLISFESWKKLTETKSVWLEYIPSTLIVRS